jgi:ABC-type tungstate transport system substrate-binding protein
MSASSRPSPVCVSAAIAAILGFLLALTVIKSGSVLIALVAVMLGLPGIVVGWLCVARKIYRILSSGQDGDA